MKLGHWCDGVVWVGAFLAILLLIAALNGLISHAWCLATLYLSTALAYFPLRQDYDRLEADYLDDRREGQALFEKYLKLKAGTKSDHPDPV